jgi:hypothetical protein
MGRERKGRDGFGGRTVAFSSQPDNVHDGEIVHRNRKWRVIPEVAGTKGTSGDAADGFACRMVGRAHVGGDRADIILSDDPVQGSS